MKNLEVVLIIHNVRSAHNAGSLLRSADGFGVRHVYFTGYTPYPAKKNDERLPHLRGKIERQINKTALGAQRSVSWSQNSSIKQVVNGLKKEEYLIAALEQTGIARSLSEFKPSKSTALIVGNEVDGLDEEALALADIHLQIPMSGIKESFNVAVSGAIALYHLRFYNKR